MLQETVEFQKLYILLWGVFSSGGIQSSLTLEYGQFQDCQRNWFDVLHSCVKFKTKLIPSTTESKCLQECSALCKRLKEVRRIQASNDPNCCEDNHHEPSLNAPSWFSVESLPTCLTVLYYSPARIPQSLSCFSAFRVFKLTVRIQDSA